MKLTSEQLHERGPPLTDEQRNLFNKESRFFGYAGLGIMAATTLDFCAVAADHSPTRSEIFIHGALEATGAMLIVGVAIEFARAATSSTATFDEVRQSVYSKAAKFMAPAALAFGIGGVYADLENTKRENYELAHSAEAKRLPKMDCDKPLYKSSPTTPRHFAQGREEFVFQHHMVDCSTPAPKGFKELSSPLPIGLISAPEGP